MKKIMIAITVFTLISVFGFAQTGSISRRRSLNIRVTELEQRVAALESANLKQATVIASCIYLLEFGYNQTDIDSLVATPEDKRDTFVDDITGQDFDWTPEFTTMLTTNQTNITNWLNELKAP